VHQLAGLAYKQAVGLLGANVLGNFNFQFRGGLCHNGEHLHILQQINVNVSVCIDIKTTLLISSTFLWTS